MNSRRIREKYLQAVLRQDITYFDNIGAGEVATRIQTDTRAFIESILMKIFNVHHINRFDTARDI